MEMATKYICLNEHREKRFHLAPATETFYFLIQTKQWRIKTRLQKQCDLFKL